MSHIPAWMLVGGVALCPLLSQAQVRPLRDNIQSTYNFRSHLLTNQQRNDKSAVMDQFWSKVKIAKLSLLPALRTELANMENPPFFLYDGSMLLLTLSDTQTDRRLALGAISQCDLLDVEANAYFGQVHCIAALSGAGWRATPVPCPLHANQRLLDQHGGEILRPAH